MVLENPKNENLQMKWLLLMHGLPILGLAIPFFNILSAVFLWIHKREDNPIYDKHGRAIINFQITITLLFALAFISLFTIEGYGFLFFISVIPFSIIVIFANIIYVVKAQKCYYPLSIRFLARKNSPVINGLSVVIMLFALGTAGCHTLPDDHITRLDGSIIKKTL
jgi:uncharacterized Tic20 family protein